MKTSYAAGSSIALKVARTLTDVVGKDGGSYETEVLEGFPHETVGRVRLYHGIPGAEAGHAQYEPSYFDRLWEYRDETERFYMVLRIRRPGVECL